MPQLSGISLLKSLRTPPKVIFTTAYSEHAIESYELDAVDYLLKPIKFDRFLKAINKLKTPTSMPTVLPEAQQQNIGSDLLFVKSEGKLIKIDLDEVQFIEGLKDYIAFNTTGTKVTIHSTMKAMEEKLAINPTFLRIHKSYIVNLKFVNELDGNCMRINKHLLSIGTTYRDIVNATLEKFKRL
jgi:DNA-binding LytR/AlgR family response regulator